MRSYLEDKKAIAESACMCGVRVEDTIYPKVMLVAPDLRESKNSEKTTPIGPALVDGYRRGVSESREAYVLVSNTSYESDVRGLRSCCEQHKTPVIKESELEQKLDKIFRER